MIYLVTGTPGSGKTLFVVRRIMRGDLPADRPIVHNVADFDPRRFPRTWRNRFLRRQELRARIRAHRAAWSHVRPGPPDLAERWSEFEDGTTFVLDEVQRDWGAQHTTANAPDFIKRLDTHRHRGFDFWLITQDQSLISPVVRRFVGRHFDLVRPMGAKYSRAMSWEGCNPAPPRPLGADVAEVERIRFDKRLFRLYRSATIHSQTFRVPRKLVVMLAVMLGLFGVAGYYGVPAIRELSDGAEIEVELADASTETRRSCVQLVGRMPLAVMVRGELRLIDPRTPGLAVDPARGLACLPYDVPAYQQDAVDTQRN